MTRSSKAKSVLLWILRILLSVTFLVIGGSKLTATMQTREFFAAIGWGQWFRYLTGVLDVTGAVLLLLPRWTFLGALLITGSVGTASILCLFLLHQYNPAVPIVFTLLAALLAWLTRQTPQN